MFELFSTLTDNQMALLGCLGASAGAVLLLALSYYAGGKRTAETPGTAKQNVIELEPAQSRRRAA